MWLGETKKILEDNVSVNFSFFVSYSAEKWSIDGFQEKLASFLERMDSSSDEDVKWVTNDFMLDFYLYFTEHEIILDPFLSLLNQKTRDRLLGNYNFWKKANSA